MFFIFGWGHRTTQRVGAIWKNTCGNCHNESNWVLTKVTTWFTLFFIPIIPYSAKNLLTCPVCNFGVTLNSDEVEKLTIQMEAKQLGEPQIKMKIYRASNIDPAVGDMCENAIATHAFSTHGTDSSGRTIVLIKQNDSVYVALVEIQNTPPFGDALIIAAVYKNRPEELDRLLENLKER